MKAFGLAVLLNLICLGAILGQTNSDSTFLEKLRSLPPADSSRTELLNKVPSVILTDKGAFINHAKDPIPYDQVLKALADLPKSAWPCGRLIIFFPFPPGTTTQRPPPAPKAKEVEDKLKAADLQMEPAMSI
jgi:hypothetical protein